MTAIANGDTPTPTVKPTGIAPAIVLPARITGARIPVSRESGNATIASGTYTAGQITYEVDVENPTATALDSSITIFLANNTLVGNVPVKVPAKGKTTVTIPRDGFTDGCQPSTFRIQLHTQDSPVRTVKTTPTCTFTTTPINETPPAPGPGNQDPRAGKLSYSAPSWSSVACGSALVAKATVSNQSPSLIFAGELVIDPIGTGTALGTMAQNAQKQLTVTIPSFGGIAGDYILKLKPLPANFPTYQPGAGRKIARACKPTAALD